MANMRGLLAIFLSQDAIVVGIFQCIWLPDTKGLLINYGEGGGYKMGKSRVQNFLRHPLKTGLNFLRPPFKEWKLYAPSLQYG